MNRQVELKTAVSNQPVEARATEGGAAHGIDLARIWTAKGYGWQTMATDAVASLIVRPTTVAMGTFYNNTSKNFVIERVFSHLLVSIANSESGLWLCMHPIGMTAPTNDITVRNSTIGLAAGTEGIFDNGAAVLDNGWFPWGESRPVVTATKPGGLLQALVAGCLIVKPTAAISIQVVSTTAVVTACVGLHYFSVPTSDLALG